MATKSCWVFFIIFLMWTIFSLYWICYFNNIASVLCFGLFGNKAAGILAPQPGIEPAPSALKCEDLPTRPRSPQNGSRKYEKKNLGVKNKILKTILLGDQEHIISLWNLVVSFLQKENGNNNKNQHSNSS